MVKKANEYDQEIPQSHTADQPTHREEAPQNTDCYKTPGRQLKQSNQFSLPHQDDCKSRRTQSTKWISTQENLSSVVCEQHRRRPALRIRAV